MPEVDLRRRRRPTLARRILTPALVSLTVAIACGFVWWSLDEPVPEPLAAWVDGLGQGPFGVSGAPATATATKDGGAAFAPPSQAPPSNETRTEPMAWWLAAIARQAGRGLVVDPAVGGEVTASFAGNTWRESLEAFSRTVGFSYLIENGFIEVRAVENQARAGPGPEGSSAGSVPGEPNGASPEPSTQPPVEPSPVMELVRLSSGRTPELAELLSTAARGLGVHAEADAVTGTLLLTGDAEAVARTKTIVAALDVPRRSVLLEVQIVELSRKAREELGIQWSLGGRIGTSIDFPAADVAGEAASILLTTTGRHAVNARLAALEADGLVRVVSQPRVVVMEGRPASIESVRVLRIRLPDRTALVDGDSGLSTVANSRAVEEIPVGVSLNVSPIALGNGRVLLAIKAKSSTLGLPQPPDGIPEEFSRLVEAEVVVADGETAVLGGLMRQGSSDAGSGVPVLRSIPVLGRLFGKRHREAESEELLFLVTPTLVATSPVAGSPLPPSPTGSRASPIGP